MATHNGDATIAAALDSLATQTLDAARYEVIVIHNGSRDDTESVVAAVRERHPTVTFRYLYVAAAGAARARNIGIGAARGTYVTFVDDDDTVSPTFLEALLDVSGPTQIGLAIMADVSTPGGVPDFSARSRLLARAGQIFPAQEFVNG